LICSPAKKLGEAQAGGQKGRGVWGKEFLPACSAARSAAWGGKRRRILRQQKGKAENFSSLKEKLKKEGARQKNEWKNFLLCSPQGERRRWADSAPLRTQIVAQKKFKRSRAKARRGANSPSPSKNQKVNYGRGAGSRTQSTPSRRARTTVILHPEN